MLRLQLSKFTADVLRLLGTRADIFYDLPPVKSVSQFENRSTMASMVRTHKSLPFQCVQMLVRQPQCGQSRCTTRTCCGELRGVTDLIHFFSSLYIASS